MNEHFAKWIFAYQWGKLLILPVSKFRVIFFFVSNTIQQWIPVIQVKNLINKHLYLENIGIFSVSTTNIFVQRFWKKKQVPFLPDMWEVQQHSKPSWANHEM